MADWRSMDRATLDAAYNNRAAIPEAAAKVAAWATRSAAFRARVTGKLDLAYGPEPHQRLDLFLGERAAGATVAFFHGGYWQANDKSMFSFVAEGPLAHGFNVAIVGYPIAPAARMDKIVADSARAVRWLGANLATYGADRNGLWVAGHSAGGHLTACVMGEQACRGGLAISGLFDLEPIRNCYLNDLLLLDADEARRHSPILHPPPRSGPLLVAVGAGELPELVRQSADQWAMWQAAGRPGRHIALPGHDHLSVLDTFATPGGALVTALATTVGESVGARG
jgi:acetyl esterase/lipase